MFENHTNSALKQYQGRENFTWQHKTKPQEKPGGILGKRSNKSKAWQPLCSVPLRSKTETYNAKTHYSMNLLLHCGHLVFKKGLRYHFWMVKSLSKHIKGALMPSFLGQNAVLSRRTPMLCFPDFSSDASMPFLSHWTQNWTQYASWGLTSTT